MVRLQMNGDGHVPIGFHLLTSEFYRVFMSYEIFFWFFPPIRECKNFLGVGWLHMALGHTLLTSGLDFTRWGLGLGQVYTISLVFP